MSIHSIHTEREPTRDDKLTLKVMDTAQLQRMSARLEKKLRSATRTGGPPTTNQAALYEAQHAVEAELYLREAPVTASDILREAFQEIREGL